MVTILLTSHYAPDASHMHPISSGVSILSLALKLLGSNKYRILAFLENNSFKARVTFVQMRKRELLAKKVQKLFHSTYLFCDTISLLFPPTFQPRNWQEYSLVLRQATNFEHKSLMETFLEISIMHQKAVQRAHRGLG